MDDVVTCTKDDKTYRVMGLQAKAKTLASAAYELDMMIGGRIAKAKTALTRWHGPHAGTFTDQLNLVLEKMMALKLAVGEAQRIVSWFPDQPNRAWGSASRSEHAEAYSGAKVEFTLQPGKAGAETPRLREYTATSTGQDERFAALANTVNLSGITAEVTYQRPLTAAEHQAAVNNGEHAADLNGATTSQTDPFTDIGQLITLPSVSHMVRPLTTDSRTLNEFTYAVASAIDRADQRMLDLLGQDPAALRRLMEEVEADPRRWKTLSAAEQWILINSYPSRVGSLNGIPIVARDQANRIVLQRSKETLLARRTFLQQQYDGPGLPPVGEGSSEELVAIGKKLQGIQALERRLAETPGQPPRPAFLVGFSTEGNGRAIVAIGNPDEANNVVTYVPGTGAGLGHVGSDVDRADRMAADAALLDPSARTSVIMWMDYDAPQTIPQAASASYAENAAAGLRAFQDGLDVSHNSGPPPVKTVVGHSYGTTVIGHAAKDAPLNAQNVVFVASPGVGVSNFGGKVSDLKVDPGHVYSMVSPQDPIHWAAGTNHGPAPRHIEGVKSLDVDDASSHDQPHSSYWDEGNVARHNMAAIATGRYDQVVVERSRPPQVGMSPKPDENPWRR